MDDTDCLTESAPHLSPQALISAVLARYNTACAISFSGAEDVLLLEYARQSGHPFRVFSLDTGRLHPETYRLFERVEQHFKLQIEYCFPEHHAVEDLVNRKGMFSFYEDGHHECCSIRKVAPLRRKLSGLRAWITGQRRDQNPGTRSDVPLIHTDPNFTGQDDQALCKCNPLAAMSSAEIWTSIRSLELPYNKLHERGYVSIGCEPCTRPILPGQHEREGRWWWEDSQHKECGLHRHNEATDKQQE